MANIPRTTLRNDNSLSEDDNDNEWQQSARTGIDSTRSNDSDGWTPVDRGKNRSKPTPQSGRSSFQGGRSGRGGGRGGRGRGDSTNARTDRRPEKKLDDIPIPSYPSEAEELLIKLINQKQEITITKETFSPFRGKLRSSIILNLAIIRGRSYIPLQSGTTLPKRMEMAQYLQFQGDDKLIHLMNNPAELAMTIKTTLRDPMHHPNAYTPPSQFTGIIPHEKLMAWSNAPRDSKFDEGMDILGHYLRHCYGDHDTVKEFYQVLWDEIPDERTLAQYINTNGRFRSRIVKEKGSREIPWAPVYIPNVDYLARANVSTMSESILKKSSSSDQTINSKRATNATNDNTSVTEDSTGSNTPVMGVEVAKEGTVISDLTNEQGASALSAANNSNNVSEDHSRVPTKFQYDVKEFKKAIDLPSLVMDFNPDNLLNMKDDEAMNLLKTECLNYLLQYYPEHHEYILSQLLTRSSFFILDCIKTNGSMARFIESLKLETRRNVNHSTPGLYGKEAHRSNVITDFHLEFEHDSFGNPPIHKTPIEFVHDFVGLLFPAAQELQHTMALVPVEKLFDATPIYNADEFDKARDRAVGCYITNTKRINNSKILKFEICVRSSLDIRFIKNNKSSWCKQASAIVSNFLQQNRLRVSINRQQMSTHVPVSIIASSTQHDDATLAIDEISTLVFEDSGLIIDRNEMSMQWGPVRAPNDEITSCPMLSIFSSPASARGLRRALLRLNRLSKNSKRFPVTHDYIYFLARSETYELADEFLLGLKVQKSFSTSLWVAVVHGLDSDIDFHEDYPILPDGSVGQDTIASTLLSKDEPLFQFDGRPTFTPFSKIHRGPKGVWYLSGTIFNTPTMKAYLVDEFEILLRRSYSAKSFDDLEIELADPTDDNIVASRNSFHLAPTPPINTNVIVSSTKKAKKVQAYQATLMSQLNDSSKAMQGTPTTNKAETACFYGLDRAPSQPEVIQKIDESTATILKAINDFRAWFDDSYTIENGIAPSTEQDSNNPLSRPSSPEADNNAIGEAHTNPGVTEDANNESYSGPIREMGEAAMAKLDEAIDGISPLAKPTVTEIKKSVEQIRNPNVDWDDTAYEPGHTSNKATGGISLLSPMSNITRPKSAQTEVKQTATSLQDGGKNPASSSSAEVKPLNTSPLEETEDPANGIAPTQSPGVGFYPSGRKMRKKTSLTQSDDETYGAEP